MKKQLKTTPKLVDGTWIRGNLNILNTFFIGRVCILNGEEWVAMVTGTGEHKLLPVSLAHNIRKLAFFDMPATKTWQFFN